MNGIRQLSTLPSLLDTRTTIVQDNLADLPAMQKFVKQKFGQEQVLHISRSVVEAIRGGVACPGVVRLIPEKNIEIVYPWLMELQQKVQSGEMKSVSGVSELSIKRHQLPEGGQYLFSNCGAGINEYAISWCGRMYACEMLTQGYTEPFKEGFINAWKRLPEQYPLSRVIEKCNSCDYVAMCESCPANRLAETGDYFGIPDYACREANYVHKIISDLGICR